MNGTSRGHRRFVFEKEGDIRTAFEIDPEGRPILSRSRSRPKDRVDWAVVYLPALGELAVDPTLTGAEVRLLLFFMARAPLGECQRIPRTRLARDLGVHRHTIDRAITGLTERRVLIADPDDPTCLWVDPDLFWRGYRSDQDGQRKRLASA